MQRAWAVTHRVSFFLCAAHVRVDHRYEYEKETAEIENKKGAFFANSRSTA
jgi:hypothetical protein